MFLIDLFEFICR